jgi:hypothetical protein
VIVALSFVGFGARLTLQPGSFCLQAGKRAFEMSAFRPDPDVRLWRIAAFSRHGGGRPGPGQHLDVQLGNASSVA